MNNQEKATSSSVINNPIDTQKRHHLHLEMVKNQKAINCEHQWKFMPSPVEPGWAKKCLHCGEVKLVEGSEQLDELVAWLNHQVEEFEQLATNASDESQQAYYQNCASNKQQLIKQVSRHKALAVEKEKKRVLQLQVEIKQLTRSFFVGIGDRLKEIIGHKLYKSLGYNTAAVYCPQELGITARQAQYLMAAAEVYHNLENRNTTSDSENTNHGSHLILPTSERQCRILAQLETAHQQAEVWSEAVEASEGNIPKLKRV